MQYGYYRIWFKRRVQMDSGSLQFFIVQTHDEENGLLGQPVVSKVGSVVSTYSGLRLTSESGKTLGLYGNNYGASLVLGAGNARAESEPSSRQITVSATSGVVLDSGTPLRILSSTGTTPIMYEFYTHSPRLGINVRRRDKERFSGGDGDYADFSFDLNGQFYCKTLSCDSAQIYTDKSRVVRTGNYGERLLYCYEMPEPMFGDIGEGDLDETGAAVIPVDDVFSETINNTARYQVFLQKEGPGDLWVSRKEPAFFVVEGTPGIHFAWELKAKQFDAKAKRLEPAADVYESDILLPETPESLYENEVQNYINEQEELLYEKA